MTNSLIGSIRLGQISAAFRAALAVVFILGAVSSAVAQDEVPAAAAAGNPPAAGEVGVEGGEPAAAAQPGFSLTSMIPLYLGLFLLWYLIVLRPQSSQKARRAELLGALKKNDKVITIGGVVGTVASVHESTGEVTIKSNDTSIRITREAVRDVVEETSKETT